MKKLYALVVLAVLAAAAVWANISLPLTGGPIDSIESAESADSWSKKKNDAHSTTWAVNTSLGGATSSSVARLFSSSEQTDRDVMLISPKFTVTAGNTYKVSFLYKTLSTPNITCDILLGNPWAADFDAAACPTAPFLNASTTVMSAFETKEVALTATVSGELSVVFRVHGTYQGQLLITHVGITEEAAATTEPTDPEQPDEPVTPPADDHQCAGKQLPYASSIATSSSAYDQEWTVINNNNDAKTWAPFSDASFTSGLCMKYSYASANAADDYLVSPAMHMEAGKEYILQFGYHGYSSTSSVEKVKLFMSEGATVAEIQAGIMLKDYNAIKGTTVVRETLSISPTKTGDYHITFYCYTERNKWNVNVGDFKLFENVFAPEGVSNAKAVGAARPELKVDLSWTLPTKSVIGTAFTPEQAVQKVLIYRDGVTEPTVELPGDATSWTDTEASGLTSGEHTYGIKVVAAGVESAMVTVGPTKYVGPLVPTALPATFAPTSQDAFDLFSVVKGANSTVVENWKYYSSTPSAYLTVGTGKVEDDWLIAPPVAVPEAGYYRVTFTSKISSLAYPAKLEGCVSTTGLVADMQMVKDDFNFDTSFKDQYFDFYAPAAGTYYAALHAVCPARTYAQQYYITKVAVAATAETPAAVTDLVVTVNETDTNAQLSWTNPTLNTAGRELGCDYSLEVYLDGTLAATLPAGTASTQLTADRTGMHSFAVKAVSAQGTSADSYPTVKAWTGPKVVTVPYSVSFISSADETAGLWTAYDLNNDQLGWTLDGGYTLTQGTEDFVTYNDYLVSPAMNLQPGYYKVKALIKGGYTPYYSSPTTLYYKAGISAGHDFAADAPVIEQAVTYKTASNYGSNVEYNFKVTTAGEYRLVYYVDEVNPKVSSSSYRLNIQNVDVAKTPVLPAVAENLTATAGADQAMQVTLSWTNPTACSIANVSLGEGELVKAVIKRGADELATVTEGLVPGQQTTYVDDTMTEPGYYTYSVELYTADGKHTAAAPTATSGWVGAAIQIPYEALEGDFADWTVDNVGNDTNMWGDPITWIPGSNGVALTCTSKVPNDWIISNPIQFAAGHVYKVTLEAYGNIGFMDPYSYDIYVGTQADHKAMKCVATHTVPANVRKANPDVYNFYLMPGKTVEGSAVMRREGEDYAAQAVGMEPGNNRVALYAGKTKMDGTVKRVAIELVPEVDGLDQTLTDGGIGLDGSTLLFDGSALVEVYTAAGVLLDRTQATVSYTLQQAPGVYMVKLTLADGTARTLKLTR